MWLWLELYCSHRNHHQSNGLSQSRILAHWKFARIWSWSYSRSVWFWPRPDIGRQPSHRPSARTSSQHYRNKILSQALDHRKCLRWFLQMMWTIWHFQLWSKSLQSCYSDHNEGIGSLHWFQEGQSPKRLLHNVTSCWHILPCRMHASCANLERTKDLKVWGENSQIGLETDYILSEDFLHQSGCPVGTIQVATQKIDGRTHQ